MNKPRFFEFFAGGGMARAGLGDGWDCAFANDFDPMKAAVYTANWGGGDVLCRDVNAVTTSDMPGYADLAWASFPCQDLSLAGKAAGIGDDRSTTRSGAFWIFWRIMEGLIDEGRAPAVIVLENVYGVLTSGQGRDFAAIARCLSLGGYRFGAVLLDAVDFVPQSRPRIFVVAYRSDLALPQSLFGKTATRRWHPPAMGTAISRLDLADQRQWLWLTPPPPPPRTKTLADIVQAQPSGVAWHTPAETARLITMMAPPSLAKLARMRAKTGRNVGTIYRRTRPDASGRGVQRAELRDDGIAGCLRTPGGGSSRQTLLIVDNGQAASRLLSPREAARLMGLPDSYVLPARYNDAYHVAGDGLAVPAVRYIAATLIEPVLAASRPAFMQAAE